MRLFCACMCFLTIATVPLATFAQQTAGAATPAPCSADAYRHFDFWIGEWDVTRAGAEKPSGANTISAQHGGCVILEEYVAGAYTGMSINFYDGAAAQWRQTWIANDGAPLYLAGGLDDNGAMVLSDKGLASGDGSAPVNRISWTPNDDGSVRQLWEQSSDQGESWVVAFDGMYTKKAE